jgi:hypothetical protein
MGIIVIDQSPDLFWYVSGALREDEVPLKHLPGITVAEQIVLHDMPEIVVMNGDDGAENVTKFISKIRNHVFARNTIFIVFTSNSDPLEKRNYLIAGAGFVLYKTTGQNPNPKFFRGLIKWFGAIKAPEQQLFDYKPVPFNAEGELSTYGRIGWLSETYLMLETNLALEPGEAIDVTTPLFEELEIKGVRVQCVERNKVGRYYQYANSLLCKWTSKNTERDQKTLKSWIKQNQKISKNKSVKIVFFEPEFEYRKTIKDMVKVDSRFCARGYHNLEEFLDVLEYQKPQLVLINRALIQKEKTKFEPLKKYMANNFCYCVTYATDPIFEIEEFKKQYDFAMHSQNPIGVDLLDGMITKLQAKMPNNSPVEEEDKIYFNKNSVNSRIIFTAPCLLNELGDIGCGFLFPFTLSNFCGVEIATHPFAIAKIPRLEFFRIFFSKTTAADHSKGIYHRAMVVGPTFKETDSIIEAMNSITQFGYDRWLIGDTEHDEKKKP